jgi:hypothetical protein
VPGSYGRLALDGGPILLSRDDLSNLTGSSRGRPVAISDMGAVRTAPRCCPSIGMYTFRSVKGQFFLLRRYGRWHALFEDEDLGSYPSAQQAAQDIASGHTNSVSCGDTSLLGVPDNIYEWQRVRRRPLSESS